jgi:hypothetical protein
MRNNFLGLKGFIEDKYPEFQGRVTGEVYPPSTFAVVVGTLSGYIWFGGIGLMIAGNSLFQSIGICVYILEDPSLCPIRQSSSHSIYPSNTPLHPYPPHPLLHPTYTP